MAADATAAAATQVRGRLAYLCLQATREGQASYAHVREILAGLERRGWTARLFEPSYGTREPGALARFAGFVVTQSRLWRQARDIEVLYVRAHFAALPTYLWARLRKIPLVLEVNGPYQDVFIAWPATRRLAPLFRWTLRTQIRGADLVITVTDELARWARREGRIGPVAVVPNGANTDLFQPGATRRHGLPDRYVVFFGSLARWHGVSVLLDAVRCDAWPSGVSLVIAGDGVERDRVEAAARNGTVHYLGRVAYREMPGVIGGSLGGLSVQTDLDGQLRTGLLPLKVFEMLACGIPIIVSDFPGQADLVRANGCGLVVPPGEPRAVAAAVRELASDPERRAQMGARGRLAAASDHSWDRRAADTSDLLVRLLERSGS